MTTYLNNNDHAVVQIYFDSEGGLISSVKSGDKKREYDRFQTAQLLKQIDKKSYDTVNLTNDSIRLKADGILVIVYDMKDMLRSNALSMLPNTFPQIQKEVSRYNRRQVQNLKRENVKRGRRRFAAAALVLLMLTSTAIGLTKLNGINNGNTNTYTNEVVNDPELSANIMDLLNNIQSNGTVNHQDVTIDEDNPSEEEALEEDIPENATYIDFKPTSDLEKKNYAYDNFHTIVEEEATKYGISPNLPMAMLTQESGGKEENLMQIEFDQWKDMKLDIYNFANNSYDHFVLTDNPEAYANTYYTTVSRSDLLDPRINIIMGCAITRKSAEMVNYHILAGVQCYNLGIGNMETVLAETARNTGQDVRDILSDQTNTTFVEYTHIPGVGDKDYLSHVFQFLDEDGSKITFKHLDGEGNVVTEEITLFEQENKGLI